MSQRASLNNFMVVVLHLPAFTPEIFTLTAAGRPALVLVVIASVCGPGCGTSNWGRKSPFSCGSGKPLLCGFVRRAIDRHPEHRRIVLVAPDLDGHELAQEGAEGFGILTSDRAQVLDIDTAGQARSGGASWSGSNWVLPGDGTGFVAVDERGIVISLMTSKGSQDAAAEQADRDPTGRHPRSMSGALSLVRSRWAEDRLADIRGDLVGSALPPAGSWPLPPRGMFENPSIFSNFGVAWSRPTGTRSAASMRGADEPPIASLTS